MRSVESKIRGEFAFVIRPNSRTTLEEARPPLSTWQLVRVGCGNRKPGLGFDRNEYEGLDGRKGIGMNRNLESASRSRKPHNLERTGRKPTIRSGGPSAGRWRSAASIMALVGVPTAAVSLIGRTSPGGLFLVLACKLAAIAAMGATRGQRPNATRSERFVLVEAITLGALVAFVTGLALGRIGAMPRSLLLLDWLVTLATIELARRVGGRRKSIEMDIRSRREPEPEPEPLPEVAAAIRDCVVMLVLPGGPIATGLIDRIEALRPAGWIISGGDPRRIDRLRWGVVRLDANLSGLREVFARNRPDIVIQILDPKVEDLVGRAALTRKLVNEALRAGVASLVLVANEDGRKEGTILSERILGALSGLTRSRLLRIRLGNGVEEGTAARRILRIAAKGRDGTIITLGKTGGSCVEELGGRGDAERLWAELDGGK